MKIQFCLFNMEIGIFLTKKGGNIKSKAFSDLRNSREGRVSSLTMNLPNTHTYQ